MDGYKGPWGVYVKGALPMSLEAQKTAAIAPLLPDIIPKVQVPSSMR